MKNGFVKLTALLSLLAVSLCLFTGCPTGVTSPKIAVFHIDTLKLKFNVTGTTSLSDTGSISMDAARNALGSRGDSDTIVITDIGIRIDPADSVSQRIVAADAGLNVFAAAAFSTTGAPERFLQTPDSGSSISRLATMLLLNHDLFGVNPGYSDLKTTIADKTIDQIHFLWSVNLMSAPPAAGQGLLKVQIIITEATKLKT